MNAINVQLSVSPSAQAALAKMSHKRFKKRIEEAVACALKQAADELFPEGRTESDDERAERDGREAMNAIAMVEDALPECIDAAIATQIPVCDATDLVRTILLTAANIWGIGSDNKKG